MSLISINNVSFAYDGSSEEIFSNVSFQLDSNWKLGFCGRNGRGKTTFLNLLMGKYPYQGSISANVTFDYFPFLVRDSSLDTLTVLQEIVADTKLWQIKRELSLLTVKEEVLKRPFSSLSKGEQTKVLLIALFLKENNFLLIDEPTNHLDREARELVAKYLKEKGGYILVSHDRTFLDNCSDYTLSINKNNIEIVKGSYSVWWQQKQQQDAFELAQNEKLQKEIQRLKLAANQSLQWGDKVESAKMGKGAATVRKKGHANIDTRAYYGEKSRRMQQRRKNLQRRQSSNIQEKADLLKNIENKETLKIHPLTHHSNTLLTLDKVAIFYEGIEVVNDVCFKLQQGERLALLGSNGSGKSSILRLVCGEAVNYTGEIIKASRLIISYVAQDPSFLSGKLEAFIEEQQIEETLCKTILAKLDFSREQFNKDLSDYSAGQKKKLLLAASLAKRAHLYVWDEPLNYIDVISRQQIEELILEFKPSLLFVEHDKMFCDNIASKTISLTKGS